MYIVILKVGSMVHVTKKYQVTIPKAVRDKLQIEAGEEVVFLRTRDGYRLVSAKELIKKGTKMFKDVGKTVEEMKKAMGKRFE